jgi:hypothetical protein
MVLPGILLVALGVVWTNIGVRRLAISQKQPEASVQKSWSK